MKITSILLTVILLLNCISSTVFAIEDQIKMYSYNNYDIKYNVIDSWENNQNIEITITNTGEEPIENWMLSYDFCGEIQGIWNAEIKTTANGIEYVKNAGYNCVIEPDCSANFGYTLSGVEGLPSEFSMCQERVSKTDGYEVTLNVVDSWEDNSFQGEIIITNNTDTAIECWELDIDSNFTIEEITNSWAATVSAYDDGKYILKGTYTNIIYPNSSTTLGFLGIKNGEPEIYDYSLTETVVGEVSKSEENNDDTIVSVEGMYYKDIQSDDEVDYDGNGIYFVRNQLLITAYQNVSFEEVEVLVDEMNAKIVGYIGITNDYQIEFNTDVSTEYLYQQIDNLSSKSLIEYVSLNTVFKTTFETDIDFIPKEYDEEGCWAYEPMADWYIQTIQAYKAWDKFYDKMSNVKVGLIDSIFDYNHIDLMFKKVWKNPKEIPYYGKIVDIYEGNDKNVINDLLIVDGHNSHGTHVAGIMGATFNNGYGICGIFPKSELYGYSMETAGNVEDNYNLIFEFKIAIATLVVNNVRVINMSLGCEPNLCIGASHGDEDAYNCFKIHSAILGKFLARLIELNYDFVIVSAAGNTNDDKYYIDEIAEYGYIQDPFIGDLSGGALAKYESFWNFIGCDEETYDEYKMVQDRIIVVGSIKKGENNNYYFSDFCNYGERIDVVAPGEKILSTVNGNPSISFTNFEDGEIGICRDTGYYPYVYMDGTSQAAPQVAGVAGMMYSVNPNITAEQVKQLIVETATEEVSGYGLLNAYAAVDRAYFTPSVGNEEIYDGLLMGKTLKSNDSEFENVTINVYKYNQTNPNVPPNEVVTTTKGDEILYTTTSNEFGDYVLRLGNNDMYWIEYVYEGYKTEKFITYINSRQLIVQDVNMERSNTLETVISNVKGESQMGAYVEVVSMLQNEPVYGENIEKYDDGSYTFRFDLIDTESVLGSSDENGVFSAMLDDGTYKISVNKEGYLPETVQVEAKDENVYDENGKILEKIVLTPIEASIYGTVTIRDKTTNKVSPKAGHTVSILKDEEPYTSAVTQADGTYEAILYEYGNYTVVFDEDHRCNVPVYSNTDYNVNCELESEEEEEEDEEENPDIGGGEDSGNGDGTEGDNDSSGVWTEIGVDGLIIDFNGDGDPSYTDGENNTRSLAEGVWVKTTDGTNNYFVKIYSTPDTGTYSSIFGAPSAGLYTRKYHYWTHKLIIETYNSEGKLITQSDLGYFHERVYIYLASDNIPLMYVDAITSVSIEKDKMTYNKHTDGYYKSWHNLWGGLGVKSEEWTEDKLNTIFFYKNSTVTGTSAVSPFEEIE